MATNLIFAEHANAERILRDGWELFQQKGYLGVSIDELCQRCGITKPTLYYYFQSKENLFVEVLIHRLQGFHQVIEQGGALDERLERIAAAMFDGFQREYSHLVRDLEHIYRPENASRVTAAFAAEIFIPLTTLMAESVQSGLLSGEPRFLAQVFGGLVDSFIARSHEFDLDNRQLAAQLVRFFIKGAS
jgi:AcrR family transcriptional regulator